MNRDFVLALIFLIFLFGCGQVYECGEGYTCEMPLREQAICSPKNFWDDPYDFYYAPFFVENELKEDGTKALCDDYMWSAQDKYCQRCIEPKDCSENFYCIKDMDAAYDSIGKDFCTNLCDEYLFRFLITGKYPAYAEEYFQEYLIDNYVPCQDIDLSECNDNFFCTIMPGLTGETEGFLCKNKAAFKCEMDKYETGGPCDDEFGTCTKCNFQIVGPKPPVTPTPTPTPTATPTPIPSPTLDPVCSKNPGAECVIGNDCCKDGRLKPYLGALGCAEDQYCCIPDNCFECDDTQGFWYAEEEEFQIECNGLYVIEPRDSSGTPKVFEIDDTRKMCAKCIDTFGCNADNGEFYLDGDESEISDYCSLISDKLRDYIRTVNTIPSPFYREYLYEKEEFYDKYKDTYKACNEMDGKKEDCSSRIYCNYIGDIGLCRNAPLICGYSLFSRYDDMEQEGCHKCRFQCGFTHLSGVYPDPGLFPEETPTPVQKATFEKHSIVWS